MFTLISFNVQPINFNYQTQQPTRIFSGRFCVFRARARARTDGKSELFVFRFDIDARHANWVNWSSLLAGQASKQRAFASHTPSPAVPRFGNACHRSLSFHCIFCVCSSFILIWKDFSQKMAKLNCFRVVVARRGLELHWKSASPSSKSWQQFQFVKWFFGIEEFRIKWANRGDVPPYSHTADARPLKTFRLLDRMQNKSCEMQIYILLNAAGHKPFASYSNSVGICAAFRFASHFRQRKSCIYNFQWPEGGRRFLRADYNLHDRFHASCLILFK